MLRLAPSRPPLWRTESCVQLGVDGTVRIDDITAWQERLLDALSEGVADAALLTLARSLGAPMAEAEKFIADIGTALTPGPSVPLQVAAELPGELGFAEAEAFAHGWRATGLDTVTTTRWRQEHPDPGMPLIVVADGLVDPRRAAALMATDITHLPIELTGDRVVVGPLIVPGTTACLTCIHTHRTDADPQWPLLAAQLIGRRRVATEAGLALEAAVLAARLLRTGSAAPNPTTVSVALSSAHVRRAWRVHRPHERCLCRSPEGIASVGVGETPSAPTTTATAFARPA